MKFELTIETGNKAFVDSTGDLVLADALTTVAEQVRDGHTSGYVRDPNGPMVGHWELTRDGDDNDGEI